MYIEMTSFAIPTIIIKLGLAALGMFALYLLFVIIGIMVYAYSNRG